MKRYIEVISYVRFLMQIHKNWGNKLYFSFVYRSYTLEDIFVLLVYVYSLADSSVLDDPEKERILMVSKCVVFSIVMEERSCSQISRLTSMKDDFSLHCVPLFWK